MGEKKRWVKVLLTESAIERLEYSSQNESKSAVVEGMIWDHLKGPFVTKFPKKIPGGFRIKEGQP